MEKNDAKILTLDNGLKIILYSDKTKVTNFVDLTTFFGGLSNIEGDKDIKEVIPGTAHLLEHTVCESSKYGNLLEEMLKGKALACNGCTNNQITRFFFTTVYDLENLLRKFLTIIYNPSFAESTLEKIKVPVCNEIRDSKNRINYDIMEAINISLYGELKTPLGEKEDIDKIDGKYLKQIYESTYVPNNQLLIVAGNFDEDKILDIIKEEYSKLKFKKLKEFKLRDTKANIYKKETILNKNQLDEIIISYKFDLSNLNPFERYKLDWYFNAFKILNFSACSYLDEELTKENIILKNIRTGYYYENNTLIFDVQSYVKDKEKFIFKIEDKIKNFHNSIEEFNLMIKETQNILSVRKDSIQNYISSIMDNIYYFNYYGIDDMDFFEKLSLKEYHQTIKNLDFSNRSIVFIHNQK